MYVFPFGEGVPIQYFILLLRGYFYILKSFLGHEKMNEHRALLFLEQGLLCICKRVHIYIYIYTKMYVYGLYIYIHIFVCVYIYICVYHPKRGLKMLFWSTTFVYLFLGTFMTSTLDEASDFRIT